MDTTFLFKHSSVPHDRQALVSDSSRGVNSESDAPPRDDSAVIWLKLDTHGRLKLPCAPREQWCLGVNRRFRQNPNANGQDVQSAFQHRNGDRSSTGRAPDCDSGGSGFKTRRSPHISLFHRTALGV